MNLKLLCTTLFVLFGMSTHIPVDAAVIGNEQSLFRTEGAGLSFAIDVSGWDSGPEVSVDSFFVSSPATFVEYGSKGGGSGTGLGDIVVTITGVGGGSFHAFFDLEIDEAINTFFNEFADVDGAGMLGVGGNPDSFEVDEPDFLSGDIADNFRIGSLDNDNDIPTMALDDDVAVAMGWDIFLGPEETGTLTLRVFEADPSVPLGPEATVDGSSFFITHHDPGIPGLFGLPTEFPPTDIVYSGFLSISGERVIPEPTTLLLTGAGVLGLLARRRRSRSRIPA